MARHLCIVSSEAFRCGEFLAALQESLDPDDELEIILDRDAGDHPSIDRRQHPHLDVALRMQGFFIVPGPITDAPRGRYRPSDERERLRSMLDFESRRADGNRPKWILAGLVGLLGLILVLLALLPAAKSFVSRARPAGPPAANRTSESPVVAQTPAPPVSEAPAPGPEAGVSAPAGGPERPESARPSASQEAARPRGADTPPRPEAARPREARKLAPTAPLAPAPPPAPPRRDLTPSRFPGLPRVELVRQPALGRGDNAYAVRVSDAAGRPVAGAEVTLLLSTADGTVLDIPLDSGPEPGIYQGTVPPGWPAPAGLRVRVVTSDKRVEIPLGR